MKAVSKFAALFSLIALASLSASAKTDEQIYLESCRKDPAMPVPVSVVSPTVGPEYQGATVELEFIVDSSGKPAEFAVKFAPDDTLATAVVRAVKQWRFAPAEKNGLPIATKVTLPVKIVDSAESAPLAMN